ncbi:MAG: SoxR reducing system RseC family protein [Desulfobacterales bacterium]|nr:SoxR reducing system RseC family protein [Desulfobacterales bacterium]
MSKEHVEEGVVIERLPDRRARIKLRKSSSCDDCSEKGFCNPFDSNTMTVLAEDPIGVRPGQRVRIAFRTERERKAIAVLYIIPVIAIITGAFVGNALDPFDNPDASAALFSVLFVIVTFSGIRYYSHKRYEKDSSFRPTIIEIVRERD